MDHQEHRIQADFSECEVGKAPLNLFPKFVRAHPHTWIQLPTPLRHSYSTLFRRLNGGYDLVRLISTLQA